MIIPYSAVAINTWTQKGGMPLKSAGYENSNRLDNCSLALGPDVDLDQEAKNVIEQWEENVEMEDPPRHPLQQLLCEYHEICQDMRDIEDEDRP